MDSVAYDRSVPATDFTSVFEAALEDLGRPTDATHRWEGKFAGVPPALAALYRVAGGHPLNQSHHRLLLPHGLKRHGTKVVFAIENQETVVWAYDSADTSDDPGVWQGQPAPGDGRVIEAWFSEERTLTVFIVSMWRWLVDPGTVD